MLRSAALRDLLVVLVLFVGGYVIAARLDLFEAFAAGSRAHENLNLDELAIAMMVACVGLVIYSWRRYRSALAEARQRSMSERTLAETTERYRSLFEYNPHAVFSVDLSGNFVAANASSRRMCGYSAEEINAMDVGALILPRYAPETAAAFAQAVNRQPQQVETVIRHRGGELVEVHMTGLPIVVGKEVVGVFCIAEDITERKQMERTLLRTQVAAEEADKAKSLFLANVSHEIRTPLTTLLGTNELLMDTDLDPLQTRFTETMQRSGERLLGLVRDILDFAKMEAGRATSQMAPVDVRAVMCDAAAAFTAAAEDQGLDLRVTVDPALPQVLTGDRVRIAKLLTNLLDNAVKFTEDGWIRASVSVTTSRPNSMDVLFVVEDSGIGMTDEQQGRLFDSFSQADASITRKYAGSGLGLPLCKQLAKLMGGAISVESTLGEGSLFSVVLPLGNAPAPRRELVPDAG